MQSPWTDLDRPPLSQSRLATALRGNGLWSEIRVVDSTVSTNADVAAAARAGAPEGLVLIAEHQRSGRGRLDRRWESPPRAGLLLSLLLRPDVPAAALPLVPLLAGVAVVEALRQVGQVDATLKWPNDVLLGGRKVAGILAERIPMPAGVAAVVVGIGMNVSTRAGELAVPDATSLVLEGGRADREPLAKEVLRAMGRRYPSWSASGGAADTVLGPYRAICETIGRRVAIQLPGREPIRGVAVAVDDTGKLVVRDDAGHEQAWSAGDVVHLRAEG